MRRFILIVVFCFSIICLNFKVLSLDKEKLYNEIGREISSFYSEKLDELELEVVLERKDSAESNDFPDCIVYSEEVEVINPKLTVAAMRCDHDYITAISVNDDDTLGRYYIDEDNFIHYLVDDLDEYSSESEPSFDQKALKVIEMLLEIIDRVSDKPKNIQFIYNKKEKRIYLIIDQKEGENLEEIHPYVKRVKNISKGSAALNLMSIIKNEDIELSKIIESYFLKQKLSDIGKRQLKDEKNAIRRALTIKWVRNAAVRIFNDSLRAFLELVVNAADASMPEVESVGKFGMGFFSILSFLPYEETGGAVITVKTCYKMKSGDLHAYSIVIDSEDGVPFARFEKLGNNYDTGAEISIKPKDPNKYFSEQTLNDLKHYVHYLDFYKNVRTQLFFKEHVDSDVEREFIGGSANTPQIICRLFPNELFVSDKGHGIPVEIAFTKLFVPSSSTKGIESIVEQQERILAEGKIEKAKLVQFRGKKDPSISHFLISVNDVIVCNKVMSDVIYGKNGDVRDVLISMPQETKLTIARDEIEVAASDDDRYPDQKSFEGRYLESAISSTIEDLIVGSKDVTLLSALYKGLLAWERQSAATHIKGRFTNYFRKEFSRILDENSHIVSVPEEAFELVKAFVCDQDEVVFIPMNSDLMNSNYSKLEEFLKSFSFKSLQNGDYSYADVREKGLNGEIIVGANIFFVKDEYLPKTKFGNKPVVSSLGLRSSFFVPESWLVSNFSEYEYDEAMDEIARDIVFSCTEQELIPYKVIQNKLEIAMRDIDSICRGNCKKVGRRRPFSSIIYGLLGVYTNLSAFKKDDIEIFRKFVANNHKLLSELLEEKFIKFYAKNFSKLCEEEGFMDLRRECLLPIDIDVVYGLELVNSNFGFRKFSRIFDELLGNAKKPTRENYVFTDIIFDEKTERFFAFDFKINTEEFLHEIGYDREKDNFFDEDGNEISGEHNLRKAAFECIEKYFVENLLPVELDVLMNSIFESLLFFDGMNRNDDPNESIFLANGKQVWPIEGDLTLQKLEETFFSLLYLYMCRRNLFDEKEYGYDNEIANKVLAKQDVFGVDSSYDEEFVEDIAWALSIEQDLKYAIPEFNLRPLAKDMLYLKNIDMLYLRDIEETSFLYDFSKGLYTGSLGFSSFAFDSLKRRASHLGNNWLGEDRMKPVKGFYRSVADGVNAGVDSFRSAIANLYEKFIETDFEHSEELLLDEIKTLNLEFFDSFKETILGLYNRYLDMPDSLFKRPGYGTGVRKPYYIKSSYDAPIKSVYNFLAFINDEKTLFDKIIDFQIVDFKFQTDVLARNVRMENSNIFYMPSIFANTPISILAALMENGVDGDILKVIIEESRNVKELMFISYVLYDSVNSKICNLRHSSKENRVVIKNVVRLLISYFLKERIDPERINEVYVKNKIQWSVDVRMRNIKDEPSIKIISDYLKRISEDGTSFNLRDQFSFLKIDDSSQLSFTLKQLLKVHLSGTGVEDSLRGIMAKNESLDSFRAKVKKQNTDINIGKITQSVECGSEKNPIEGSMIEALQNSIDAINGFLKQQREGSPKVKASFEARMKEFRGAKKIRRDIATIKYDIELMKGVDEEKEHLCLTMRDFVGFPNIDVLLTEFILPDYSSKLPSLGNIGDMGNGSFNMYKQSKKVSVLTRLVEDPSRVFLLVITPTKDPLTGLVDDLNLLCLDVSDKVSSKFFGTSIRILFEAQSSDKAMMDALYTKDLIFSVLGVTQFDISMDEHVQLFFGSELVNKPIIKQKDIVYEVKDPITGKYIYRIRKQKNDLHQSYISTGGMPFRSFESVVRESMLFPVNFLSNFGAGLVLDIAVGRYEPVQSRTKLQMKPEHMVELKRFLLDAYYMFGLQYGKTNEYFLENNFVDLGSGSPYFDQIRLSEYDDVVTKEEIDRFLNNHGSAIAIYRPYFFMHYKPSYAKSSFYDEIEDGYEDFILDVMAKKNELTSFCGSKLEEFIAEVKSIVDDAEREKRLLGLKEEYSKITQAKTNEIKSFAKAKFGVWKSKILQNSGGSDRAKYVSIPWFEKKIANLYISANKFTSNGDEMLQTEEDRNEVEALKESLKIFLAGDRKRVFEQIKELLSETISVYSFGFLEKVQAASSLSSIELEYSPGESYRAVYRAGNKSIGLNLAYMPIEDFIEALAMLIEDERGFISQDLDYGSRDVENNKVLKLFIPLKSHTPTLVHELEHARRNEDSEDISFHKPDKNPDGIIEDFNVCASSYFREARKDGLLKEWHSAVISKTKETISDIDLKEVATLLRGIKVFINKNSEESKEKKEFLLRELGY